MTKVGNVVVPTATATPARVRLFQPSQRPVQRRESLETPWGKCTVSGRLGQRHADLLEISLYVAEKKRSTDDGAMELLVDPAKIRRKMSDAQYSLSQIILLFSDLRTVTLEIRTQNLYCIGGVIDHIMISEATRHNPLSKSERHLWRVRLNKAFVYLLENDYRLFYDPGPLARLKNGISQAVARHVITHKRSPAGGWKIDTLIVAVAGELKPAQLRSKRRELRQDMKGLRNLGLIIEEDRVTKGGE